MIIKSEILVVSFTSPVARRPFPRGAAKKNAMALNKLCTNTNKTSNRFISSSKAYKYINTRLMAKINSK